MCNLKDLRDSIRHSVRFPLVSRIETITSWNQLYEPLSKLMTALETLLVDNTQYSEEDKEAFSTNIASIKDYIEKEVVSDESDDESEDSYSYLRTVS